MSDLPHLSHLQALVIECLGPRKVSGRNLRAMLKEKGANKNGPAFYQLMARLEEAGFVEGEYSQKIVEGQMIKERVYHVTGEGERALDEILRYYDGIHTRLGWSGGLTSA